LDVVNKKNLELIKHDLKLLYGVSKYIYNHAIYNDKTLLSLKKIHIAVIICGGWLRKIYPGLFIMYLLCMIYTIIRMIIIMI